MMRLKLHSCDFQEMLYRDFPDNYASIDIYDNKLEFNNKFGQGVCREIYFDGFRIFFGNSRFNQQINFDFESDFETIEMHFTLEGFTETYTTNKQGNNFTGGQHNLIYAPPIKGNCLVSSNLRILEINMPVRYFKELLGERPEHDFLWEMIQRQQETVLGKYNFPITPSMLQIIYEIINCEKKGSFLKLYMKSKCIELLLLQLEQHVTYDSKAFFAIKKDDIDKIRIAKEIIIANLQNPCSLIDLAHQVGTNEFTLKKGFKEVFGTTVFGMLREERLRLAKDIVNSGEMSVSEISYKLGYSTPSHFIMAYKKKYGFTPGKCL